MSDKLVEIAEDSAAGASSYSRGHLLSIVILTVGSMIIARLLGRRVSINLRNEIKHFPP
jgi:hypothetical protein